MNGGYLSERVKNLAGPVIAFRNGLFADILPTFGDIDARAREVGENYYKRIGYMLRADSVSAPLSGKDFFVTAEIMRRYAEGRRRPRILKMGIFPG